MVAITEIHMFRWLISVFVTYFVNSEGIKEAQNSIVENSQGENFVGFYLTGYVYRSHHCFIIEQCSYFCYQDER